MTTDLPNPMAARLAERVADLPMFDPVGKTPEEIERFHDHDLASYVEGRCGELVDVDSLDEAARHALSERALRPAERGTDELLDNSYWVRDGERRIGTMAYWTAPRFFEATLYVASLYIAQPHRGRGHARRALVAMRDAAFAEGVRKLSLDASWYGQPALRLYCSLGMWIQNWKRDPMFVFAPHLPPWHVSFADDVAQFSLVGEEERPLIIAERRGTELGWHEQPALSEHPSEHVRWRATGTFSVALATAGWPLIRSQALWQQQLDLGFSDLGGPEGLAFKIQQWEDWAVQNGWTPRTPKIPGLPPLAQT